MTSFVCEVKSKQNPQPSSSVYKITFVPWANGLPTLTIALFQVSSCLKQGSWWEALWHQSAQILALLNQTVILYCTVSFSVLNYLLKDPMPVRATSSGWKTCIQWLVHKICNSNANGGQTSNAMEEEGQHAKVRCSPLSYHSEGACKYFGIIPQMFSFSFLKVLFYKPTVWLSSQKHGGVSLRASLASLEGSVGVFVRWRG